MSEIVTKKCTTCGEAKPISEFDLKFSGLFGVGSRCKSCRITYDKARYKNNPSFLENVKERQRKLRKELLSAYGGRCACCGEDRYEFLALDHKNGGGSQDRKKRKNDMYGFWRELKRSGWPEGYRVLCHNCNQALGLYGFCPHERDI